LPSQAIYSSFFVISEKIINKFKFKISYKIKAMT
jgi:hypothetical protein